MDQRAKGLGIKSIRWKMVLIYVLLVLIAITITGVFMLNQLESYYTDSIRKNILNTVQEGTLYDTLNSCSDLHEESAAIQQSLDAWSRTIDAEAFVVDDRLSIVASSNASSGTSAMETLDMTAILGAFGGEISETTGVISQQTGEIPVMNIAFPVWGSAGGNDEVRGALYLRADTSSVEENVHKARGLFMRAMILALAITVLLGMLISRTITAPINDVTEKASKMAEGDFNQEVSVRSDDEIGKLAEMFNILRLQLNDTLSQISNEKNKLETVLKYIQDALIAVGRDGRIIHANPAACALLGITAEEAATIPYDTVIKQLGDELMLDRLIEKCGDGPVSEIFEAGGATYDIRYDNYKDDTGADVGIIMIIQDITERQKLENMQMDFVANVSHELKTPLTTIKSYTETLLDGAAEDPALTENFLGIIDTEADRMNRLVKELLQLSRIEHHRELWHKKDTNLVMLLKSCVTKVEMTAKNKGQHVNCLFDPSANLTAEVDRDGIEQVILNVLSNAIKYTQDGGRIDVDAVREGNVAAISVQDNGIGIPESEVSRVFERFFRVDKARSRAMGGTGLGLAISKQITEEHGGTIELESKEGRGTKVTIRLPLSVRRGVSNID